LGGGAFILAGILFGARSLLEYSAGPPPANGVEILAWASVYRVSLALANEALFFATISLVPAVAGLYRSTASACRAWMTIGCGIVAVAVPVLAVLLIVQGRLIYPIYGIHASATTAEFIIAIYYGGLHAVSLMLAAAALALSLAFRRTAFGSQIVSFGFVTSVACVVGAYQDALSPIAALICQAFLAAWFIAVGASLYQKHDERAV
jgi:hypothetical protein